VRLTGGEPLLRHDLATLVRMLAAKPALRDLALTSNGILLTEHAPALAAAGLHRLTVSLDTLRPERFSGAHPTRRAASGAGRHRGGAGRRFTALKLDTVVIRGTNDDEVVDLIEYGKSVAAEGALHRVHGRRRCDPLVARPGLLARGDPGRPVAPLWNDRAAARGELAPADRYRLPDGTIFGIISSTTEPFCRSCDRPG
jgi:cyclic pyranopterin phosphate synthase